MTKRFQSRRDFLRTSAVLAAGTPYWFSSESRAEDNQSKNDRPLVGCIGTGDRWKGLYKGILPHGDIVAVADVDSKHAEFGKEASGGKADIYEDYRKLLDRKDIDVVSIVTPDHWHTKIAIDAMRAGKDVYCEKPLTLTIDEGKAICKVLNETGRVFQVGTQQRTEMNRRFLNAVAIIRDGRIGKLKKATCAIGGAPTGGPFETMAIPPELNWEMWLGQAPKVDYTEKRCHYEFRWWYEYSGGKMTDWGAHHVDIASWALGADASGPISVEGTATHPHVPNGYNTATEFLVNCKYADGAELIIRHDTENGITFEGDKGSFFVARSMLTGPAVDELKEHPLPEGAIEKLYGGKPTSHMANFFQSVKSRKQPISDVFSHHRSITTCHLANIAIRLGRKINWDPVAEQVVGDSEAQSWQSRAQRKGYEIVA
ncbi:MAG TPA: Gfo/Idh/MocA family oxidoreductase [Pirellulales bacterium]|jgi:predicted dehydrogenase|nr:Gfo/Idh/MocA family oxidoreductase [Pirellulales bacterium]